MAEDGQAERVLDIDARKIDARKGTDTLELATAIGRLHMDDLGMELARIGLRLLRGSDHEEDAPEIVAIQDAARGREALRLSAVATDMGFVEVGAELERRGRRLLRSDSVQIDTGSRTVS